MIESTSKFQFYQKRRPKLFKSKTLEGRGIQENGNQEWQSFAMNLNLFLAPPPPSQSNVHGSSAGAGAGAGGRGGIPPRRSFSRRPLKEDRIRPPYPWATDKRATVYSYEYMKANGIDKISGKVCGKRCEQAYTMEVELNKVLEVCYMVLHNFHDQNNRATTKWRTPKMLDCEKCN
ncbi:hypothetical protein EJ110_NYTH50098 [Nymphaea thermarum]|nr:hypothetical protein EJ110_NYTH50098 [Nymphaea thermarum]